MKTIKISKYNVLYTNEYKELSIINGLYDTFLKFDPSISKRVNDILISRKNDDNDKTNNIICEFLKNNNIIIDSDEDENKLVDFEYNKMAYGDKTLRLTIIPTDSCNFRCVYCYEEERNNYMTLENSEFILKFLKANLKYYSCLRIAWFGGEPLLAKDLIITFMKKVKRITDFYKVTLISEMTTNGYFLTKSLFEQLFDCGVISYQITLDGFKDIHNKMRPMKNGGDSYTVIYDNLSKIKNETNKRAVILIRVNFNYDFDMETLNFIDHIKKTFLEDDRFLLNVQGIRNWGGDRVKKLNIKAFQEYDTIFDAIINNDIDPIGGITSLKYAQDICNASKINYYLINYDLSIHKCSLALNHGLESIGQIDDHGEAIIDRKKEMQWIERKNISQKCYNCILYPFCMANICPYVFNIKCQMKCEDFKFSFYNKIKILEKSKSALHIDNIIDMIE